MIKRVENYLAEKPDLNEKNVTNVSQAAASLLKWLVAVVKYYYANKKVKPKKAKLAVAQAEVAKLQAELSVKQAKLKEAVDKVNSLNQQLQVATDKKNRLEAEYDDSSKQLVRAQQLIEFAEQLKV